MRIAFSRLCYIVSWLVIYHCLAERIDRLDPFPQLFLNEETGNFLKKIRERRRLNNTEKYFFFFFFSRRIFIHGESFFYYLVLFYMCVRFFFFIKSDELRIFRDTMRLAKRVEMCMHRCCKHGIIIGEM